MVWNLFSPPLVCLSMTVVLWVQGWPMQGGTVPGPGGPDGGSHLTAPAVAPPDGLLPSETEVFPESCWHPSSAGTVYM